MPKSIAFIDKHRKQLWIIFSIALFAVVLILFAFFIDEKSKFGQSDALLENTVGVTNQSIQIEIPLFKDEVTLVSPAIIEFLDPENTKSAGKVYKEYVSVDRNDRAFPATISYKINGIPEGCEVVSSIVEVSENAEFTNPFTFELKKDQKGVEVYFLKTATKYFYRIILNLSDEQQLSTQGTFLTADTHRTLKIDGATTQEKVEGYLLSIVVTPAEIASIREILLEN